ncbi:MAG: secretin N-terminal domain-containing protein [Opitutaceae bacterium]|nr:secretin N-terminal domain-containing protein [Opitutaceae bacterium]
MSTRFLLSAFFALALVARVAAQAAPAEPQPADQAAPPAAAKPAEPPAVQVEGSEPEGSGAIREKDTLSVDFPDEDIKTILRNVADLFELNLVVPDTLTGKTSIKLRDVTWRQIFQVVLTPVNYTFTEEGNIIKIISNEFLTQEPVATDVFILNYAKAGDIKPTLDALVDSAAGGKIVIDARSNALVITERPSRMNRIRPIIESLDKATDQVMIESKFVEVTDSDVKDIGVNWSSLAGYTAGVTPTGEFTRNRGQEFESGNTLDNQTTTGTTQTLGTANTSNPTNTSSVTSTNGVITATSTTGTSMDINSSSTNGTTSDIGSALGILQTLTNTGGTTRTLNAVFSAEQFKIVLSALQAQQKSKIVSNPTIVTLNNTEATINVGTERPLPRYTFNQQTGTLELAGFDYKPIGIILRVTPQVNNQGFIKLTVEPEVSQSTRDVDMKGIPVPVIDTRKAKTQVSLKDGFTMGIGGLLTTQSTKGFKKVPVLSSIPGLGRLFRSDSTNALTTNLIIFITARTVSAEGATVEQVFESGRVRQLEMRREELPGFRDGSDPFVSAAPAAKPGEAPGGKPFFRLTRPGSKGANK